jgi:hypothetical protein
MRVDDGGSCTNSGNINCLQQQALRKGTPDAIVMSLQFSIGGQSGSNGGAVGGYFKSFSLDLVVTSKDSALFFSKSVESPTTQSKLPREYPLALAGPRRDSINKTPHIVKNAGQMVTPQIGFSMQFAELWSDGFSGNFGSVQNYEGPSTHEGGSIGPIGIEKVVSNSATSGKDNDLIIGSAIYFPLPEFSFPPAEYHKIVFDSIMIEGSKFNTPNWLYSLFFGGYR